MWGKFTSQYDEIYKFLTQYNRVVIPFYIFLSCPALIWVDCSLFPGEYQYNHLMRVFSGLIKSINAFILLSVNAFYLGSHSACKVVGTLCESIWRVPSKYIPFNIILWCVYQELFNLRTNKTNSWYRDHIYSSACFFCL